jgi:hypothetical protein
MRAFETFLILRSELYQKFQRTGLCFRIPQMMCLKLKQPLWKVLKHMQANKGRNKSSRSGNAMVFTGTTNTVGEI